MVAATCFFVMKSQSVFPLEDIIERRCTGYFGRRSALREFCVLYKYIDWLITVPLQMVEIYLTEMGYGKLTKLLGGTVIMLVARGFRSDLGT